MKEITVKVPDVKDLSGKMVKWFAGAKPYLDAAKTAVDVFVKEVKQNRAGVVIVDEPKAPSNKKTTKPKNTSRTNGAGES